MTNHMPVIHPSEKTAWKPKAPPRSMPARKPESVIRRLETREARSAAMLVSMSRVWRSSIARVMLRACEIEGRHHSIGLRLR